MVFTDLNAQRGQMFTSADQDSNFIYFYMLKTLWYVKKNDTVKTVFTGGLFAWCPALNESLAP